MEHGGAGRNGDPDEQYPEPADEAFSAHLDRLEAILAERDGELRRLKTELDLRNLYVRELHSTLVAQAAALSALEKRIRRIELESTSAGDPALPVLIRIKKPL
ncbi:MAG: hypothetical protein HY858_00525 [Candidatus Solibacter usitatus]|nr:hypothetical protein [Candidatus Solibacter usitatus]